MAPSILFPARVWFSEPWEIRFVISVTIGLLVAGFALVRLNRTRPDGIYDPQRAWLRAGLYFMTCFLLSWATGVLPVLRSFQIATAEQLNSLIWWVSTVGLTAVVLFSYGFIWRRGTHDHGRPLFWIPTLAFGILWGFATGELLLSVWSILEKSGFAPVATAIGTFLIGGSLNGLWHAKYWDTHVSPDHNILECNKTKILFAHCPNLIFSLGHLALFGNPYVFVLMQITALTISTAVMHFPPFWGPASAMRPQHDPEGRPRTELESLRKQIL